MVEPPAETAWPPFTPSDWPGRESFCPLGFGPVARALGGAPYLERPRNARIMRFFPRSWGDIQPYLLYNKFIDPYLELHEVERLSDYKDNSRRPQPRFMCCACEERELHIEGLQEKGEGCEDGWEEMIVFRGCQHVIGRSCLNAHYSIVQPDGSNKVYCPVCTRIYYDAPDTPFHRMRWEPTPQNNLEVIRGSEVR